MAYSNNPYLPRARALAMKLLLLEQKPVQTVANKCGVHRSTIYRWKQKWLKLNEHVQFTNDNRPSRPVSLKNKLAHCKWRIATIVSAPHSSPHALDESIIRRVLELRYALQRCAEVIWHHMTMVDGVAVSLSSVHRILRRHHQYDGSRKNRVRPDNPKRPQPAKPGELVQMDTIHYICPITYQRRYVYTVIDLYSRMAYAEMHAVIRPGRAAGVATRAQMLWGFKIAMMQTDNGPEFSRYFEQQLQKQNITLRHTRLGRPNDNAHIERFNRTIQEECLGNRISSRVTTVTLQTKIASYIEHYNTQRVHLGIQLRTPMQMLQRS
jgi:transposase InsO family protein/transposase-like protein